jgi:hypothetical protein
MEYDLFDVLTDYRDNEISKEKALDLITDLFVEESPVFNELYKSLGWQGGTIHQALDEIKRLKNITNKSLFILTWVDDEGKHYPTGRYFDAMIDAIIYIDSKVDMYFSLDGNNKSGSKLKYHDLKLWFTKYQLINPFNNQINTGCIDTANCV